MTTHTPGPWHYTYGAVYADPEGENCIALADRSNPRTVPTERDANARLIAAAPELLEALEAALKELQWLNRNALIKTRAGGDYIDPDENVMEQARAAIAKAKGIKS